MRVGAWLPDRADRLDPLLLLLVALAYAPALTSGLFPWDDREYLAAASSAGGLWEICSGIVLGNFHPLTMCSLWVGNVLGGGAPWVQHLINIALHAASCLLVRRVVDRLLGDRWMAMGVALLFAVHPVHVESVAWIAERKNVLYAFFYLLAVLHFTLLLERHTWYRYAMVVGCALLAMLSKGQAVTLPMALVAIAVIELRTFRIQGIAMPLLPVVLLSLAFGLLAVHAQNDGGYMHPERVAGGMRTVVLACHALVSYALRLLCPARLSIFHPFPIELDWTHYLSVVLVLGGMAFWVDGVRRRQYVVVGCILFFVSDLLPLLQFIPVGEALTADRYVYVASVPFLMMVVHGLHGLTERSTTGAHLIRAGFAAVLVLFAYTSNRRAAQWDDGPDLFMRLANDHPGSDIAQYNMAAYHQLHGEPELALAYYTKVVEINGSYVQAWYAMGALLREAKRYDEALVALDRAVLEARGHPNEYLCYHERALCHKAMGLHAEALRDVERSLQLVPAHGPAHYVRALLLASAGRHSEALPAYGHAERLGYDRSLVRMNRAISKGWVGYHAGAVADLDLVIAERADWKDAYFLRGVAKQRIGRSGCADLEAAAASGHAQALDALHAMCR